MVVNKIETIEDYAKFIKENKKEVNELYHDLTALRLYKRRLLSAKSLAEKVGRSGAAQKK